MRHHTPARALLSLPLLGGLRELLPVPSMLEARTPVPAHVAVARSASVLSRATRPGVNLAIWLRDVVGGDAGRLAFDALPPERIAVDAVIERSVRGTGASLLPASLRGPIRTVLAADIDRLAAMYTRMTGLSAVHVKLNSVDSDECRLFHVDHVHVRLVTTYVGPGTDWLEDSSARREHLGGRGLARPATVDAINNAIVSDWTRVHRLPRFAVAAFRGTHNHNHDPTPGIVHRSPPIAGTGITRLRLVVEASSAGATCSG
jgi:hypothetical protein